MTRVTVGAGDQHKVIIKRLLDEAAEAEASTVRILPGLRDVWLLILKAFRGH